MDYIVFNFIKKSGSVSKGENSCKNCHKPIVDGGSMVILSDTLEPKEYLVHLRCANDYLKKRTRCSVCDEHQLPNQLYADVINNRTICNDCLSIEKINEILKWLEKF